MKKLSKSFRSINKKMIPAYIGAGLGELSWLYSFASGAKTWIVILGSVILIIGVATSGVLEALEKVKKDKLNKI